MQQRKLLCSSELFFEKLVDANVCTKADNTVQFCGIFVGRVLKNTITESGHRQDPVPTFRDEGQCVQYLNEQRHKPHCGDQNISFSKKQMDEAIPEGNAAVFHGP